MEKNKKILAGAAALGIVATVAVGGTLAYLTDITEKRANQFTFSEPISAILTEPDWDGVTDYLYPGDDGYPINVDDKIIPIYGWDETDVDNPKPIFGYKIDGGVATPVTIYDTTEGSGVGVPPSRVRGEYGNTTNQDMVPGQVALKNPKITNTSADIDEWVAAQVSFVYASGTNEGKLLSTADMQSIVDYIEIDWNTGTDEKKWELISPTKISKDSSQYVFYYNKTLKKCEGDKRYGEETNPIFNSVKVKENVDNEGIAKLNAMGGFVIYIEGFAVQDSVAASYGDFITWAAGTGGVSNVTFANSPTKERAANLNLANGGIVAKGVEETTESTTEAATAAVTP